MPIRSNWTAGGPGIALALLLAPSASAHHALGGAMPASWTQGLMSGLAHPILGIDHLAFVVGVGLLAAGLAT